MKYFSFAIGCMGLLMFSIGVYSIISSYKPVENTTLYKPVENTTLYCINNKIYEKYENKFYKPHYNAKTGLAEMCVEIDSK
jgi:hypothetical protein